MEPSPTSVSETVTAMTVAAWPTTPEESQEWLRHHGIDPDTATERAPRRLSRNWDRARTLGWRSADSGWGTFRGEFVGANWFLWRGSSSDEVMAAAHALADLLTQAHGAPTEATESTEHGGTWLWQLPDHVIDMYAYHGLTRPDGFPAGDACVQLHVDLRERAEAQEEHARAHPAERPAPLTPPDQ